MERTPWSPRLRSVRDTTCSSGEHLRRPTTVDKDGNNSRKVGNANVACSGCEFRSGRREGAKGGGGGWSVEETDAPVGHLADLIAVTVVTIITRRHRSVKAAPQADPLDSRYSRVRRHHHTDVATRSPPFRNHHHYLCPLLYHYTPTTDRYLPLPLPQLTPPPRPAGDFHE